MKKNLFIICALACGLAFSSCGKKDAANALSDSAKEITEEITEEVSQAVAEFNEAEAIQLTEDMDSTTIAEGTSMTGFRCTVCSCPSYTGVYQGYHPNCYGCGHAYGMHR